MSITQTQRNYAKLQIEAEFHKLKGLRPNEPSEKEIYRAALSGKVLIRKNVEFDRHFKKGIRDLFSWKSAFPKNRKATAAWEKRYRKLECLKDLYIAKVMLSSSCDDVLEYLAEFKKKAIGVK